MTGPLEQLAESLDEYAEALADGNSPQMIATLAEASAALRAQAEANKGFRTALAHYAEIRHYDHAGRVWSGDVDQHEDAQIDMGEIARAALAQAAIREEP